MRLLATATWLLACAGILVAGALPLAAQGAPSGREVRVALFFEAGFPAVGAPAPDRAELDRALRGLAVTTLGASSLSAELRRDRFEVLLLPYGSAFPVQAWEAIAAFLADGGNLVNLGGAPFAAPTVREGSSWRRLEGRTAFSKALGLLQSFPVAAAGLRCVAAEAGTEELCRGFTAGTVMELSLRLTSAPSIPDESGSDGDREARVDALAYLHGGGHVPLASPFLRVDRLRGRFAGGRWVLATGDGATPGVVARRLVEDAARGAVELTVRPTMAGYHPSERPAVEVRRRTPGRSAAAGGASECRLAVSDPAGREVATVEVPLSASGEELSGRVELALPVDAATGPYHVRAELGAGASRETGATGFWRYTPAMVTGGRPLAAGRRYFEREGKPFPVIGTTYMAGDTHRRFLLEPNPAVWERDFAALARSGANLVRTGIWTGWRNHCAAGPLPSEEVLRALEVFVLTARAHDLPVIFTFFAFVPERWGGTNPYLDPAAVAAQKTFLSAFARRLAGARDVIWDLINEPSFSSPDQLWRCRPHGDAHEQAAWSRWTRERLVAGAADPDAALADRWNLVPGEPLGLPQEADFGDRNLFEAARPRRAADYKRFAQWAFSGWTRELAAALRAAGDPRALVTVGQDENGITESPNPLLFGADVDFTCNHTWWLNDALLWDSLVTRLPDRPNLIEETGVMTSERLDGSAWRSEEDARDLLERKLVLALGAGSAGAVQWLWNTNVYMPIDNEAGIGLLRAAGSAKPELAAFAAVARLVRAYAPLFAGAVDEEVVVVVPHSQVFSVRDLATAATQRAVRTLEYDLRVPVRLAAESGLRELGALPLLVVVPSPRALAESSWNDLLGLAGRGATVLLTGPFDRDEVERPTHRVAGLGLVAAVQPVAQQESVEVAGKVTAAAFRGSRIERVEKAVLPDDNGVAPLREVAIGDGRVLWCPLPVELAEGPEATVAVYAAALARAGAEPPLDVRGGPPDVLIRAVLLADAALVALVNESDGERTISFRLRTALHGVSLTLPPRRSMLALVSRSDGTLLDRT